MIWELVFFGDGGALKTEKEEFRGKDDLFLKKLETQKDQN